jgi:RNase adaptor protein for sRNA GlmZ degradation
MDKLELKNKQLQATLIKLEIENTRMKEILFPVMYELTDKNGEKRKFRVSLIDLPEKRLERYYENRRQHYLNKGNFFKYGHNRKEKQATSSDSK